jgi:hypothetical protein
MLVVGGYSGSEPPQVYSLSGSNIRIGFGGVGASILTRSGHPGVIFDERNDRYLAVANDASGFIKVYLINPSTWEVDEQVISGVPPSNRPRGIFNSVQYVPELRGFVMASGYTSDVYFIRTAP